MLITYPKLSGILVFTVYLLSSFSCASPDQIDTESDVTNPDLLNVVTTVSPITSIVENIGGTYINLVGIVPEGVNSHTYEPPPSVAKIISNANLIILNGLFLEEPFLIMAEENAKPTTKIIQLGNETISSEEWVFDFSFPESDGHPNPHLWTDPILALKYADIVRKELVKLDPENAEYFNSNFSIFQQRIENLDYRISNSISTIPPKNRKLLTYHDSFPFFASRYGMQIIGAVQPSNFSEPSAREVARLIDQVIETGVPAIFGSEVFPSSVMKQIAKESNVEFIDQLRDDDLPGSSGDPQHSYLGLMESNITIIVPALGGRIDSMVGFDTSLVFEGKSRTKYPE